MSLPRPHLTPLWRESRVGLEYALLRRSAVFRGEGVPPGEGRGVLLVPGFLAGDASLATMTQWLRAAGYRTKSAGIRANIACSEVACTRLEERLECLAAHTGGGVMIVGHSRGGVLAKAIAARRPELVSGVVTLGSPVLSQLSVHPVVLAHIGVLAALGTSRVPGLISWRCLRGECCARFRAALDGPLPPGVGYVAVYSRSDGIVDWRACRDSHADACVEVRASHCGMGMNAGAYGAIARALERFGGAREFAEAA